MKLIREQTELTPIQHEEPIAQAIGSYTSPTNNYMDIKQLSSLSKQEI